MYDDSPAVDVEDAAMILAMCASAFQQLEDKEIENRAPYEPLPRGVLTCGQALSIVTFLMYLITRDYPVLLDRDVFDQALKDASLRKISGYAH